MLRFWESKFPQLKPLKRGGGRRYYRPEDILLLRHIRQCLYQDGYTIRGVQKLLGSPGDDRAPETGRPILPTTMPTLFPLDVSDADPPPANRPPGAAEEPPVPEKPARRPRRRPTGPSVCDPEAGRARGDPARIAGSPRRPRRAARPAETPLSYAART